MARLGRHFGLLQAMWFISSDVWKASGAVVSFSEIVGKSTSALPSTILPLIPTQVTNHISNSGRTHLMYLPGRKFIQGLPFSLINNHTNIFLSPREKHMDAHAMTQTITQPVPNKKVHLFMCFIVLHPCHDRTAKTQMDMAETHSKHHGGMQTEESNTC